MRPTCWECGKALMYSKGKPVFVFVVEDGAQHKVHKACKASRDSGGDAATKYRARRDVKLAFCSTGCQR